MAGEFKTIGDAVVTFLNAQSFSQAFTATRQNRFYHEVESSNAIQVTIFPIERSRVRDSRKDWRIDYTLAVAVTKKIVAATAAAALVEQDNLMALADEIEIALATQTDFAGFGLLPTFEGAAGTKAAFNDEQMDKGVFVTGITFTVAGHI